MPLSEENISQIERYLDGEMSTHEKESFEQAIAKDSELKDALHTRQVMVRGLKMKAEQELKVELKAHLRESQNQDLIVPFDGHRRKVYWLAASVIFILGMVFVYNLVSNQQQSAQKLFDQYYSAFPRPQIRGNADTQKALDFYSAEDFSTAIPLLETLVLAQDSLNHYRLFLGSSYLSLAEPNQAIEALEPLLQERGLSKNHARWYIMLAYLKKEDLEKAKTLLNEIIAVGDDYLKKAKTLLSQLPD